MTALALAASAAATVHADIDPLSGIEFVTVGAVGNAAWAGNGQTQDQAIGRGSVGYEYRIGRFEVTTLQWVEFFNAAIGRADSLPHIVAPQTWAATVDPTYQGPGTRYRVGAGGEMYPVGDIGWRMAAMYCNWLHNGKSNDREAFMSGAYDVSTFGSVGGVITDQEARSPGARYFIPTWDEWLKAAHYDPNKQNSDGSTGGWWTQANGTDSMLVYATPANGGQANAWFNNGAFNIPLGAYANTQSPWGLFDVAGATSEWTESLSITSGGTRYRIHDGSYWTGLPAIDELRTRSASLPMTLTYDYGFRIAAAVPAPGVGAVLGLCLAHLARRRR